MGVLASCRPGVARVALAGAGLAALATASLAYAVGAPSVAVAAMATARSEHTATYLDNGLVLVVGGRGSAGYLQSAETYDRGTNAWTAAASLSSPRAGHTATLLRDSRVLVTGGRNNAGALATAEVYDTANNGWASGGRMTGARLGHTATLLPDGRVLVVGGLGPNGPLATADLFDPQTSRWSAAARMSMPRSAHTATLLDSGDLLVTGGVSRAAAVSSAEIYHPASNSWRPVPSMVSDRMLHSASLLPDGRVLVVGGVSGGPDLFPLGSVELYDPAANGWSPGPPMTRPRFGHAAITLCSGRVLVAGGTSVRGAETEQYDSQAGAWVQTLPLLAQRSNFTATQLIQLGLCSVLVAGGVEQGREPLNSVELFNPTGVIAASTSPGTTVLPPAPGWLSLSLLVLVLTGLALILLGRRPGQAAAGRPLIVLGFQLSGVLIATWLLLTLARVPVAAPANVAGAARPHELQLLNQPLAQVLFVTSIRSLGLIGLALAWSTFVGLGIAVVKLSFQHRRFVAVGAAAAALWITPTFVLAILVQEFQAFVAGHTALVVAAGFGDVNWIQLFWAAVVLGLRPAAYFFRHSDQVLNLEAALDYVRTAQAKGLPWPQIVSRHMLRAAALPLLSTWSNSLRVMVGSLPLVEYFFGYPGLGRVLILSLGLTYAGPSTHVHGDLAMGLVVMMAAILITLETAAALLQQRLDPRLRTIRAAA